MAHFAQIDTLPDETLTVRVPVTIALTYEDGKWFGALPSLALYSFGDTKHEVIEDIQQQIVDLYTTLHAYDPSQLGRLPTQWRQVLRHHIIHA